MVVDLSTQHSVLVHWLRELRDIHYHHDKERFRRRICKIGEIMAYEISRDFFYKEVEVQTPLAKTNCHVIEDTPVILSILRAGLTMHQGLLSTLDFAESGFIAAYRSTQTTNEVEVAFDYSAHPNLNKRNVILCDPMLATGSCLSKVISYIKSNHHIDKLHIATLIATPTGIQRVENVAPSCKIWTCHIDEGLDSNNYIIPGLGDAGDISYGKKE